MLHERSKSIHWWLNYRWMLISTGHTPQQALEKIWWLRSRNTLEWRKLRELREKR